MLFSLEDYRTLLKKQVHHHLNQLVKSFIEEYYHLAIIRVI